MLRLLKSEGDLLPTLSIAFASVLWGVYWIPVRHLEGLGLEGVWPQIFLNVAFFMVALPVAIFRFKEVTDGGLRMMRDTFLVGMAITLYGNAFIFTDVVRAVLLFYLGDHHWYDLAGGADHHPTDRGDRARFRRALCHPWL